MIKKIKQLLIITAIFALAMPTAILAESAPTITIFVFGEVKIDGNLASSGTVSAEGVSASIGSDGKYSIELLSENVEKNYKVNGINATKTPGHSTDSWKNIDLSVITPKEPATNTTTTPTAPTGGTPPSSPPTPPIVDEDDEEEPLPEPEEEEEILEEEEEVVVLGVELNYRTMQINRIMNEAECIWQGDADLAAQNRERQRDESEEGRIRNRYVNRLMEGVEGLTESNIRAFANFILYSTETTDVLGAGERAGVLNSYKSAFGKLPVTEEEWQDAIKIGNGRWPNQRSETAENNAKNEFKKVYLREANMENPNDNAAITVMAYGLRPDNRNLDSEKAGIKTFRHIYRYSPVSAIDWDVVRAIAYSGATR